MNTVQRLGLGICALALPIVALAAPPANVTGITAMKDGSSVRVTWTQVQGDVSSYRIFYSHASILGNNGLYDDFETTDGSTNSHLLQNLPPVSDLYVTVLAVNSQGEESQYFQQEAHVSLGAAQTTSSVAAVSSAAAASSAAPVVQNGNVLRLLSVQAISATGMTLTFSAPVTIPGDQAATAIVVQDGSGNKLTMRRFIIQENVVTVHTLPQKANTVYRVSVSSAVKGRAQNGQTIALASDQGPVLFTSFIYDTSMPVSSAAAVSSAATSVPVAASSAANIQRGEVRQLKLRAQPDSDATYAVEVSWLVPASTEGLTGYALAQSTNGTFGEARNLGLGATTVKIGGVPPGRFSVMVKDIYIDGSQSRGVTQSITLPRAANGGVVGSVTGSGSLSNSGPGLATVVTMAGAMAGAWRMRKTKKSTQSK